MYRPKNRTVIITSVCCILIGALAGAYVIFAPRKAASPPDTILITVDALPAYKLETHGYGKHITPYLDDFASQSFIFTRHFTNAPWTFPAIASLMTSRYPTELGIQDVLGEKLDDSLITLAELLKQKGYYTAASLAALPLRKKFNLDQGFVRYHVMKPRSGAEAMTDNALHIIRNAPVNKPLFLWLHYFDPHCPYNAPEPYRNKYVDNYRGTVRPDCSTAWRRPEDYVAMGMTERDGLYLSNRQDGEIEYTDREIGRLFTALKKSGRFDSSLIIVSADHGEEFFTHEHRFIGHGIDFYDTVIRVPLLMKFPGQTSSRIIEQLTRHIDLTPTLLDHLFGNNRHTFSGVSLMPAVRGTDLSLTVFSEYNAKINFSTIRYGRFKYIHGGTFLGAPIDRLYDLDQDPDEQTNIAHINRDAAAAMKRSLLDFRKGLQKGTSTSKVNVSQSMREKLKELGYVQ